MSLYVQVRDLTPTLYTMYCNYTCSYYEALCHFMALYILLENASIGVSTFMKNIKLSGTEDEI